MWVSSQSIEALRKRNAVSFSLYVLDLLRPRTGCSTELITYNLSCLWLSPSVHRCVMPSPRFRRLVGCFLPTPSLYIFISAFFSQFFTLIYVLNCLNTCEPYQKSYKIHRIVRHILINKFIGFQNLPIPELDKRAL